MWYCSRKQLVVGAVSSFGGGRSSHAPTSVESRHWRGTAPLCQLMTSSIYLIYHDASAKATYLGTAWKGPSLGVECGMLVIKRA